MRIGDRGPGKRPLSLGAVFTSLSLTRDWTHPSILPPSLLLFFPLLFHPISLYPLRPIVPFQKLTTSIARVHPALSTPSINISVHFSHPLFA